VPDGTVTGLGFEAPGEADKTLCTWSSTSKPGNTLAAGVTPHGLNAEYQKQQSMHFYAYFQPTNLDGYPAVISDVSDDRTSGTFGIVIGINDKQIIHVQGTDLDNPGNGKTMMLKAASAALKTVKKGA
jgi:hypothetical protein